MGNILTAGGFVPTTTDTPLDARTRVATFAKIADIENPYKLMRITVEDTGKTYEVRKLTSKVIGGITVGNAAIDINDADALFDLGKGEEERSEAETIRQENEAKRISAEEKRTLAESNRQGAESDREKAELARAKSESSRDSAETNRQSAETARSNKESERISNESARVSAESKRASNEETRISNENARKTSESQRQTEEYTRVSNEAKRIKAENDRVSNENNRIVAEGKRDAAEKARANAESTRNSNEELRKTTESGRVTAEQGRVEAEIKRGTDFDTLKSEMQTAIDEGKEATKETIAATEGLDAVVEEQNAKLTELSSEIDKMIDYGSNDFSISDENGYDIAQFSDGHIKTKNFDSSKVNINIEEDLLPDFAISDENGADIVQFINGHIKTKSFDSRNGNYNILCIGDSLTAGGATTKNYLGDTVDKLPYPTRMKELFPKYNWVNLGVGGENINTIFGRIGAIPFVVMSDVIIPSDSSSKVEIQLASSWTDADNDEYQQNVFPFRQGGTQWYSQVYINGHTCKLTYTITDGSYAYFAQRLEDGVEIKVNKGTRIYTQYPSLRPKLIIIFAGFNDLPTSSIPYSVDRYIEQLKTCISVFNAEYIVISKHTIYGSRTATERKLEERINEEKKLQKAFGANYLDWRKYGCSQAIYDAIDRGYIDNSEGLYPTEDDLKWMNEGQIPTTLMSDSVHLNHEGTLIFCDYIKEHIDNLNLL